MGREGPQSRPAAGRKLVAHLQSYAGPDTVVLGVSRGGIPVGLEVARGINAPFEALTMHTLADPERPEHTVGDIVERTRCS